MFVVIARKNTYLDLETGCSVKTVVNGSMRIVFKSLISEVLKQLIKLCSTFYIRFDFYSWWKIDYICKTDSLCFPIGIKQISWSESKILENAFCIPKGPSVKGFCTKLTDIGRLGGGGGSPNPLSIIQKPHKDFTRTTIFFWWKNPFIMIKYSIEIVHLWYFPSRLL